MYAKVKTIATALLLVWGGAVRAAEADSVKTVALEQVTVGSSTATATTPVAYTHLSSEQLTSEYFVQDMPFLLSGTPSVIATSDAGNGTGYTYIRIRGTDATRINVTTNGVPMNDPESHALYLGQHPRPRVNDGFGTDSAWCGHLDQWRGSVWRKHQYVDCGRGY